MTTRSMNELGSCEELMRQLHWERHGFEPRFGSPTINYSRRNPAPVWLSGSGERVAGTRQVPLPG